jgi:hypothetical protein
MTGNLIGDLFSFRPEGLRCSHAVEKANMATEPQAGHNAYAGKNRYAMKVSPAMHIRKTGRLTYHFRLRVQTPVTRQASARIISLI